jgi:hypothetical protein
MRVIAVLFASLALWACGEGQSHPYPDRARAAFNRTCKAGDAVCECMWAKITHALAYEEYEAALARYQKEGLMDPRISRARTECLERHAG